MNLPFRVENCMHGHHTHDGECLDLLAVALREAVAKVDKFQAHACFGFCGACNENNEQRGRAETALGDELQRRKTTSDVLDKTRAELAALHHLLQQHETHWRAVADAVGGGGYGGVDGPTSDPLSTAAVVVERVRMLRAALREHTAGRDCCADLLGPAPAEKKPAALREALAALCHAQWSGWMEYLLGRCSSTRDGALVIAREDVVRWRRQVATKYEALPEGEQNSDRKEADRILCVLAAKP